MLSVSPGVHKSNLSNNAVNYIISSGSASNVTVSLPPINNSEEPVPLEVWVTLYLPTSMQVSVPDSRYSVSRACPLCVHACACVHVICVCGFVSKHDKYLY